jgi:hypothetical protein
MIDRLKDIISENPAEQVWKLLRYFLDGDIAVYRIRELHNVPEGEHESNVKKQAMQIGYCIRQAEEYFKASSRVTLATRPTLLYYGAVSLSQALVLLRKDGTYSFDARRKQKKHNHHGLELKRGLIERVHAALKPCEFLDNIRCSVYAPSNQPSGQFSLFYDTLVPGATGIEMNLYDDGKTGHLSAILPYTCADLLPLSTLIGRQINMLSLLKLLPDMSESLSAAQIMPDVCRGRCELSVVQYYQKDAQGRDQRTKAEYLFEFYIDGTDLDQTQHLLEFYKQENPAITLKGESGSHLHLHLTEEHGVPPDGQLQYRPDIVEDMNRQKYYLLYPKEYIPEPATLMIALYCLGMMSRYYPDIWMKVITENVFIAELLDTLLNIAYRKLPNLILDQMTFTKHSVHP